MALCGGNADSAASKAIEDSMKKEAKKNASVVRLLLLGAGESGKSTISKQMKIIHLKGFTDQEKESYKEIVYSNIVSSVKVLSEAARRFGCSFVCWGCFWLYPPSSPPQTHIKFQRTLPIPNG